MRDAQDANANNLITRRQALLAGSGGGVVAVAIASPEASAASAAVSMAAVIPTGVQTGDYTASPGEFVPVDASSGAVAITLPTQPADQTQVGVEVIAIADNTTVTVVCGGSDVLNRAGGPTSLALLSLDQSVILQYQASTAVWYTVTGRVSLDVARGAAMLGSDGTVGGPHGTQLVSALQNIIPLAPSGDDDSSAIEARASSAAGDLRLGVGSFVTVSGIAFTSQTAVSGVGGADFLYGNALTEITTSSQTAVALTLNQAGSIVERLGIRNTGSSAPTSGAGIVVPGSQISDFRLKDVHCRGFYDGIDVQGRGFVIENYVCTRTYRYGIRVGSSSVFGDRGLGVIENVFLYQGEDVSGVSAFRWEAGGGLRMHHFKTGIMAGGTSNLWQNGIDLLPGSGINTTELHFSDGVIDGCSRNGVSAVVGTGAGLHEVSFDHIWMKGSNGLQCGYYLRGLSDVSITSGRIALTATSGSTGSAIDADSVTNMTVTDVDIAGVSPGVPWVKLGGHVIGVRLRLGWLSNKVSTSTYPAGQQVWLVSFPRLAANNNGIGGDCVFSWQLPAIASNSAYTTLWRIDLAAGKFGLSGGNGAVKFELVLNLTSNASPALAVYRLERLAVCTSAKAVLVTTLGVDTGSANLVDFQFDTTTTPGSLYINAKIDSSASPTSVGGYSVLRIDGSGFNAVAYT